MNFLVPDEPEIVNAIYSLGCDIFCFMDARKFLMDYSERKSICNRLISYLVCLRVVPNQRQKWGLYLHKNASNYSGHIKHYFSKNPTDPFLILPERSASLMNNDFKRTISWFKTIATEFGVDLSSIGDPLLRISRIYSVLTMEWNDFRYSQGYDRYGCLFLAYTLAYCQQSGLGADFAESMTYYLTRSILSIVPMATMLDNHQAVAKHFNELENVLMNYNYGVYKAIKQNGSQLLFFGVRWELLLYADEHDGFDILSLWDYLIGQIENYEDAIKALTIAHITQVPLKDTTKNINETILHFKSWDIKRIIDDATNILKHKKGLIQELFTMCCPIFPSIHGYQIN